MKNKKGEIATLLTLGLVVVGTLITLGTSLFVSSRKNNLASNSKAADYGGKACCFCQKGKIRLYASSTAQEGLGPCTTARYGTAYGASSWGYCNDNLGAYVGGECKASDGDDGNSNDDEDGDTDENSCIKTTCDNANFGNSDHPVAYFSDSPKKYYFGEECDGDTFTREGIIDKCQIEVTSDCTFTKCSNISSITGNINYDSNFAKGKGGYQKTGDINFYDSDSCDDTLDITTICLPEKKPTCEPISCTEAINNGKTYTGDLYYLSDDSQTYYGLGCQTEAKIDKVCTEETVAVNTGETDIPFELKENGAPGVKLDSLFCDATNIKYSGSPTQVAEAVTKCTGMGYSSECLKIVGSDKGWDVTAPYLYCCSDKYNCKQ